MAEFSDFIVYADESGDHGLVNIDPQFPVFALTFCVLRKNDYAQTVVPSFQALKFSFWGHDSVVLHEHEIRKSKGPFRFLMTDAGLRARFYQEVSNLIVAAPMTVYASVINKDELKKRYVDPWNPYEISLLFCMEQLCNLLNLYGQRGKTVHVVFESRGPKEDSQLELEFRRISVNAGQWGYKKVDFTRFDFQPVFMSKAANSTGLQLADLTARPIALSILRPAQPNRAMDVIRPKLGGLKCFP